MVAMNKSKLKKLIDKRHRLIPGAAHTYSKGDDQFPANAPKVIIKGAGAYVWDENGKKYLDWCMGLRSVSLGHCYKKVNDAVSRQMKEGTNFGRPHAIEFELADYLIKVLPATQMVKFAKNGSTVTTAAIKLARAHTGRKYIAFCKDHPFFSYDDWFIGTTACDSGVPEEIRKLTLCFRYNDISTLEKLFNDYRNKIACVIMEAATSEPPRDNFLKSVQNLCHANRAVFILDEMITGFRWGLGGAQKYFGIKPDLSTYGKGIANGYSLAVLAGRRDIMELGGIIQKKSPKVFLISTTHGAETISLAAGMATIEEMKNKRVTDHFWKMGKLLQNGLQKLIAKRGIENHVKVFGFPPNLSMGFFDKKGESSALIRTVFLQEIVSRNILFQGYFAVSFSHKRKEISDTLKVFDQALSKLAVAISDDKLEKELIGPTVKGVFQKYN
ncbi:MAG: glutamate-1-semialdehyde aminotransferase [Parcubacteria group bacterium Licking1014_17]|nr:MAG: glutamate-1-semialdehyde aminotransferase [Parcubacteria group bacterium Licking1014_17]